MFLLLDKCQDIPTRKKTMKKIKVLAIICFALVGTLLLCGFTGPTNEGSTVFTTSNNPNNYLHFEIEGNVLYITGKIDVPEMTSMLFRYGDVYQFQNVKSLEEFKCSIPLFYDKQTSIDIFTLQGDNEYYYSYFLKKLYIEKRNDGHVFCSSNAGLNNYLLYNTSISPSKFTDNTNISSLVQKNSNTITQESESDYDKVFELYKWVVNNIYYDYDFYDKGEKTFFSAEDVLLGKRATCEGIVNLLHDMIIAQEIPCAKATVYSLGKNAHGGSFAIKSSEAENDTAVHEVVEAYIGNRWIIMDPTWDVRNQYINHEFIDNAPNGYLYFDISLDSFSMDHKYITRADGEIYYEGTEIFGGSLELFDDIKDDEVPVVSWAVRHKLVYGFDDNLFHGNDEITVGQAMAILSRYIKPEIDKSVTWNDEYQARIQESIDNGIINDDVEELDLNAKVTYADAAQYIQKANSILTQAEAPIPDISIYTNENNITRLHFLELLCNNSAKNELYAEYMLENNDKTINK